MAFAENTQVSDGSLNDCNVALEENTWDHLFLGFCFIWVCVAFVENARTKRKPAVATSSNKYDFIQVP